MLQEWQLLKLWLPVIWIKSLNKFSLPATCSKLRRPAEKAKITQHNHLQTPVNRILLCLTSVFICINMLLPPACFWQAGRTTSLLSFWFNWIWIKNGLADKTLHQRTFSCITALRKKCFLFFPFVWSRQYHYHACLLFTQLNQIQYFTPKKLQMVKQLETAFLDMLKILQTPVCKQNLTYNPQLYFKKYQSKWYKCHRELLSSFCIIKVHTYRLCHSFPFPFSVIRIHHIYLKQTHIYIYISTSVSIICKFHEISMQLWGFCFVVQATCQCISGTGLLRHLYVLPHWDRAAYQTCYHTQSPYTSGRPVPALTL